MNGACSEEGRRKSSAKIEPKQKSTDEGGAHRLINMTHRKLSVEYISVLFMFFHDQLTPAEPLLMYTYNRRDYSHTNESCFLREDISFELLTPNKQQAEFL